VNQQMADKNLIGGKYTVYLHLLQVFWQKTAKLGQNLSIFPSFLLSLRRNNDNYKNNQVWKRENY
jgi:hypothetical protein